MAGELRVPTDLFNKCVCLWIVFFQPFTVSRGSVCLSICLTEVNIMVWDLSVHLRCLSKKISFFAVCGLSVCLFIYLSVPWSLDWYVCWLSVCFSMWYICFSDVRYGCMLIGQWINLFTYGQWLHLFASSQWLRRQYGCSQWLCLFACSRSVCLPAVSDSICLPVVSDSVCMWLVEPSACSYTVCLSIYFPFRYYATKTHTVNAEKLICIIENGK